MNAMHELSEDRMLEVRKKKNESECTLSCIITVSCYSAHSSEKKKKCSVHFFIHELSLAGEHVCYGAGQVVFSP